MEAYIIMALLTLLAVVTLAIVPQRSLFAVLILASMYSFLMATVMVVLDAVDVAMTEAAVGAGVSTVILLATLHLTRSREYPRPRKPWLAMFVALAVGGALIWGTFELPRFGDGDAPMHRHVAPHYINETKKEIGVPNLVTAVLADYRSFDTLGETIVVFTAGLGVILLLRGRRRRREEDAEDVPGDLRS